MKFLITLENKPIAKVSLLQVSTANNKTLSEES